MVKKYLGVTIDIHGGGHDLTFPHHECEIAQSEAHTGHPLAKYWMHNGYIHINNEKMSKSLGNSILVRDILTNIDTATLRYFVLSTHYRNPLNFTDDAIAQASKSVERIANCVHNLKHRLSIASSASEVEPTIEVEPAIAAQLARIVAVFNEKMGDDFNTADAITAMFDWVTLTNVCLQNNDASPALLQQLFATFETMNEVLSLYVEKEEELLDAEIEQYIIERTEARKAKQWARADEIRDILTAKGVVLEDTPQGVRWRRL